MIHIGICDSQMIYAAKIEQILRKLYGKEIKVVPLESAFALENYVVDIRKGRVDILFVNTEDQNQELEVTAKRMKEEYDNIQLVLLGEDAKYMIQYFVASPSFILLRPITEQKLQEAMNYLLVRVNKRKRKLWIFEGQSGIFVLPKEEILYLENDHREISVVLTAGRVEKGSGKLGELLQELGEEFHQCHQSYIVNMNKIWELTAKEVVLHNGERIPVSRPRYKEMKETLEHFVELNNQGIL